MVTKSTINTKVVLRDGKVVEFNASKITSAVKKAFTAVGKKTGKAQDYEDNIAENITDEVVNEIAATKMHQVDIEHIQDYVEKALMKKGFHNVAKEYILYRNKRTELRKKNLDSTKGVHVVKRDGSQQELSFDKVDSRISLLSHGLNIDKFSVVQKVIYGLFDCITTKELDNLIALTASNMVAEHSDYDTLAARVLVSNLHKETGGFAKSTQILYENKLLNKKYYDKATAHMKEIEEMIDYERDYMVDFFGMSTLKKSYLLHSQDGQPVERFQDLLMRVSLVVTGEKFDAKKVKETYELLSHLLYTHATPTLHNAGSTRQQLASCFLLRCEDNLQSILDSFVECGLISQSCGGIAVCLTKLRGTGAKISTTNGTSSGIVPPAKIYAQLGKYVDQGGGKRNGAIVITLEPWHPDIHKFIKLRDNVGADELRARDVFTQVFIPDIFMRRAKKNETWTLFDPSVCPKLANTYGEEFEQLYLEYEKAGLGISNGPTRYIMANICKTLIETGTPYCMFKDTINETSNQKNIGMVSTGNLCTEIVEHCNAQETAVCNLASIALHRFLRKDGTFDFDMLRNTVETVTYNLDNVIDATCYPSKKCESNVKHRPIGIGVQGLADLFMLKKIPFDSDEAADLDRLISEHIQFASLEASAKIARDKGSYETFEGSPLSQGKFHHELWEERQSKMSGKPVTVPLSLDWDSLRKKIMKWGMRHSLHTAYMPTASTSIICRCTECFQPQTTNIGRRKTVAGEFMITNAHLVRELQNLGLWTPKIRDLIILHNGSIQDIHSIPGDIKEIFKTVWEIKTSTIIDRAAARQPFISQSQSMNLWMEKPSVNKMATSLMYGWDSGVKTAIYYLRSKPARNPEKMTVFQEDLLQEEGIECECCTS